MNDQDKNLLMNFSPLITASIIMFLMLWAYETMADDHNITAHGHIVDDEHLIQEREPLYAGNIRNAVSKGSDQIIIEMNTREKYLLTVSFCWDLPMAQGYIFGKQDIMKHFNKIEKGLRIWTLSAFGRINSQACIVTDVEALEVIG